MIAQASTLSPRVAAPVRPFESRDLTQVVELYTKVFPRGREYSAQRLHARFEKILLRNPWYDPSVPSLVYEQAGKIVGFLGVVVRPMVLRNVSLRMAVSNHFMVDPDSRTTKAGLSLLSRFFSGPQDLALAEAGDASRKIWEALGGYTSFRYSLYWTRVLRPARYGLYQLERTKVPRYVRGLCRPLCNLADGILSHMTQSQVHRQSRSGEEEISVPEFLECISRAGSHSALRPVYDEDSLNWLLTVLAEKRVLGSLHKSVVRGKQRQIIGWYTYYLNPGGVSTVLQMWSSTGRLDEVLNHISYHARHNGSIALTGRMQPAFTKEYSTNQCFLHWRSWMLLHSRDPKILESVENQDAFFTTLEGESWIGIEGELADTGSS